MTHWRKGQKLINYARFIKKRAEAFPPSSFEGYLWNMPDQEFDEIMDMPLDELIKKMEDIK